MVSKACEDPMDLGPFLQNYVLRNPFHEMACASFQSTKNRIPGPSERRSNSKHKWAKTICLPSQSKDKQSSQLNAAPSVLSLNKIDPFENSGIWKLDDKLDNYMEIQTWLQDNFRHVPGYQNCSVSNLSVLYKVQDNFPQVTSNTLDQLVNTTFPGCVQINRKNGTFYQGLVSKPEVNMLENSSPSLKSALDNITKGIMSVEQASKTFHISETVLVSAVAWGNYKFSNGLSLKLSHHQLDGKQDDFAEITKPIKSGSQLDNSRNSERNCNKRHVHKNCLSAYKIPRMEVQLDDDDNIDFELMLQDGQDEVQQLEATNSEEVILEINSCTRPEASEVKKEAGSESSPSGKPQIADSTIKVEPLAEDYTCVIDSVSNKNQNDPQTTFPDNSNSSADCEVIFKSAKMKQTADQRNQFMSLSASDISRISPHPSSQTENVAVNQVITCELDEHLRETQNNLDRCERTNIRLQGELKVAKDENLMLQDELNTRDFQLANLAEEFFKLHNQFKRLAQHFQLVLTAQQNTDDQW